MGHDDTNEPYLGDDVDAGGIASDRLAGGLGSASKRKRNIYGVLPCPKCGDARRWPTQPSHTQHPDSIFCDECGHVEPLTGTDKAAIEFPHQC